MLPAWIKRIPMPKHDGYALHMTPVGICNTFHFDGFDLTTKFPTENDPTAVVGFEFKRVSGIQLTDDELVGMAIHQMMTKDLWYGQIMSASLLDKRRSLFSGSASEPVIKFTLCKAAQEVQKGTLSIVTREDMHIVIGKEDAKRLGQTQEVADYLKSGTASIAILRGDADYMLSENNIPAVLYGFRVHEEPQVPQGTMFMVAVSGSEGVYGVPDFSTVQEFHFNGHRATLLTCPASGCMIENLDGEDADTPTVIG